MQTLTRRSLVSAAPTALAVAAVPTIACASADHADAELLELDTLLANAASDLKDLGSRCEEALDRFQDPPIPEALFWRASDFPSVWVDPWKTLDSLGPESEERYTYASEGVLEVLREKLTRWKATDPESRFNFTGRDIARVKEIISGVEAWEAERAKTEAACGYTAIHQAQDAKHVVLAGC